MKIAIVTDAWSPQVNGVVTTLVDLRQRLTLAGHEVDVIEPSAFRRLRCPGYAVLDADLRRAALAALAVPRERARARAREFDLDAVCRQFLSHLVPIRRWKPDAGYPAIAQFA